MRQVFALGLGLIAALPVGTALGQTESQVRIQVLSDDTCLVYDVPIPCRDVGAKLRELGTPTDANIHISASSNAKYETVALTFEALKHAGFTFKLGYINVAPK